MRGEQGEVRLHLASGQVSPRKAIVGRQIISTIGVLKTRSRRFWQVHTVGRVKVPGPAPMETEVKVK